MLTINLIMILLSMPIKEEVTNNMLEYKVVVVVGDKGVGKSALISRFATGMFVEVNIHDLLRKTILLFFQMFLVLPNVQTQKIHKVGSRITKFEIVEFNDLIALRRNLPINKFSDKESDHLVTKVKSDNLPTAYAILLCFSISSRSSLSNAVTNWVPSLIALSPSTPLVLVGCKTDMRNVHSPAHTIISSKKALAMSKHCGAVMYV